MKYLCVLALLLATISASAQLSFTTPIGANFKAVTLIMNKTDQAKSLIIYNDLENEPIQFKFKKDTVISNLQLTSLIDPKTKKIYFISWPLDMTALSIYDNKFKLIANLSNDSYQWHTQRGNSKNSNAPAISPQQLAKLFMLLL